MNDDDILIDIGLLKYEIIQDSIELSMSRGRVKIPAFPGKVDVNVEANPDFARYICTDSNDPWPTPKFNLSVYLLDMAHDLESIQEIDGWLDQLKYQIQKKLIEEI